MIINRSRKEWTVVDAVDLRIVRVPAGRTREQIVTVRANGIRIPIPVIWIRGKSSRGRRRPAIVRIGIPRTMPDEADSYEISPSLKRKIRDRDRVCQDCGRTEQAAQSRLLRTGSKSESSHVRSPLQVHHLKYGPPAVGEKDLVLLCYECHGKRHAEAHSMLRRVLGRAVRRALERCVSEVSAHVPDAVTTRVPWPPFIPDRPPCRDCVFPSHDRTCTDCGGTMCTWCCTKEWTRTHPEETAWW